MSTRTIKDPTYNIYAKGGNVETSKNSLDKKDLEQLAKKDKEVLEFDAIEDQLQELLFQHQEEAPEISFSAVRFLRSSLSKLFLLVSTFPPFA